MGFECLLPIKYNLRYLRGTHQILWNSKAQKLMISNFTIMSDEKKKQKNSRIKKNEKEK